MTAFLPQRALVTGAGGRLGQAMATALGGRGLAVAVHYNGSRSGAEGTAQQVIAAGGKAVLVKADLSCEADASGLVQRAAEALGGPIDCLINNASVFEDDTARTHSRADWDRHMDVNLRAPIVLAQAMAANLGAGVKGLIVNMIDQRVFRTTPTFFSYTLSKHALWTATRTLAQSLAPDIRVNGIGPGPTLQNARQSADDFSKQCAATLTGEGANPEEIVRALLYLMDASAVTGQMIAVDGGQHLVWQTPDIVGLVE
jgi:NAD(P)-dependent dehydrogenase (short-subunit alcohol dehydrogenase family)